ncbi:ATP-dependent DNA helicase recG [Methanosarcina siciliae C2J]|uniref:ATP-dependent DNA helicase recG n=1 Tax=Methanosarcina siciliae C2J TaxID=1434118 RepID=A0A0E3PLI6_9EURY|nr:winged helix-turn-helix transcriptional regulator [Methanosarcina siciliae]AKB35297.1 ATP-dependent DNA helicase recG [Methanosarcina siciliae C2J]
MKYKAEISIFQQKIEELSFLPRNPTVARIFRVIRLSENAGSGFDKMFGGWKSYDEVEPEVSGEVDYYKIVFPLEKVTEIRDSNAPVNAPVNAPINAPVKLTISEEEILELIENDINITYDTIAESLGKNRTTIMRNIKKLKDRGILTRIGSDKTGHWIVIRK